MALALAACVYYWPASSPAPVSRLPAAYALCADAGRIYTVDEHDSRVDCILVNKHSVAATGSLHDVTSHWDSYQNQLIKQFYGNEPSAKKPLHLVRAPPGSIVVPGLQDAHGHLIEYGAQMQLSLDGADTIDEVLDRIEAFIASRTPDKDTWIEGMGWDHTKWRGWDKGFPTAADLASRPLLSSYPLALRRVDHHALWLSPRAIALTKAALPSHTWPKAGKLPGGQIIMDASGEPAGVFVDKAMDLVPIPPRTDELIRDYATRAMQDALSVGLTSVHDAGMDEQSMAVFIRMAEEGELPIRVYAMHMLPPNASTAHLPRLHAHGAHGRLTISSVKLFTDGALGSWGAALIEPYHDKPETSGLLMMQEHLLKERITQLWAEGWGVNVHCIGDKANKVVLDIFESFDAEERKTRRPRIEHAQIMRVDDLKRAGALNVLTSVQPTHATSDMWYAETRLGPDRIKGAYAYQSLLQASPHKILPLGSDFPVESINPLLGFYAAVTRLDVHGRSPHGSGGWYPAERLTRAQALRGMTHGAAYAAHAEAALGALAPGARADYVVLARDVLREDAPAAEILETRVCATVVDGQIAFGAI